MEEDLPKRAILVRPTFYLGFVTVRPNALITVMVWQVLCGLLPLTAYLTEDQSRLGLPF
jgi:hypothetical protein